MRFWPTPTWSAPPGAASFFLSPSFTLRSMAVSLLLYDAAGPDGLVNTLNTGINTPFLKAFFFSIHTSATIGYGSTVPGGIGDQHSGRA